MPRFARRPGSRRARPIDYHEALRDIARSLVRLKRPERFLKMITRFISRELGLTHAAFLVFDPEKSSFTVYDSKGMKRLPRGLFRLDFQHPLVRWFQSNDKEIEDDRAYLSRSRIQTLLQNTALLKKRPELETELLHLRRSLNDFRAGLAIPGHFKDSLVGILLLGEKLSRRLFTQTEIHFFQTLVHDAAIAVKTSERFRKKEQETYYQIMKSLAQQVHAKDPYTFGHIQQVERLGILTAQELGLDLSGRRRDILSAGLLLHDVGKIGIPDQILKKPGPLTDEEWKVMRTHVEKGAQILAPLTDFKEAAQIVRCHHENYDGSGYPRGLKRDEIPIEARIVSVVDAFHAIISNRCYRAERSTDIAFQELQRCAGSQFDPDVVKALVRALKRKGSRAEPSLREAQSS